MGFFSSLKKIGGKVWGGLKTTYNGVKSKIIKPVCDGVGGLGIPLVSDAVQMYGDHGDLFGKVLFGGGSNSGGVEPPTFNPQQYGGLCPENGLRVNKSFGGLNQYTNTGFNNPRRVLNGGEGTKKTGGTFGSVASVGAVIGACMAFL